jgi:O-antigen ligase/Flp pilus assembly protein TadD
MVNRISKAIAISYYLLFFFVPLILYPYTSELFEFNKMIVTYLLTVVIITLWLTRSVLVRKFEFKRTALDIPLAIFLATQLISTLVSFDFRTSLLGYYSRYHGGFMSSVSYAILYWAFVSNMSRRDARNVIRITFISAFLVSIYAVLERFGIDKDVWVQDVQNRVFSTLGQPNWLAAFIVALIPITWSLTIRNSQFVIRNLKEKSRWVWVGLSALFYLVLVFTKSRSGFVGFATASIIFWPSIFLLYRKKLSQIIKPTIAVISLIAILTTIWGTPWTETKNISYYLARSSKAKVETTSPQDTPKVKPRELDVRISPSGDIRKIVWSGAVDIWKNYPVFGTGVETFAYSYYNFRPVEHNLLSEWDFLYNKAHNEYLNILANTGSVGFISYAILVGSIIMLFLKESGIRNKESGKNTHDSCFIIHYSLLVGFVSILVTNFFGFSVVPVGVLFFLFPAIAVVLAQQTTNNKQHSEKLHIDTSQKIGIIFVLCCMSYVLFATGRYWYSDLQYSKGVAHNNAGNYVEARRYLIKATRNSPNEAVFWSELSESSAVLGLGLYKEGEQELANNFIANSINESQKAEKLSPKNVNIKRKSASNLIKLSAVNPELLISAIKTLQQAIELAPTEAKLYYNYGLAFARAGDSNKALDIFDKTIEMKSNYRHARFARALLLVEKGETENAKEELEYILERIDPNDSVVRKQLEEI